MGRPNIIYRHPLLYKAMLYGVHGKHLRERYQQIAEQLQGCTSVFEPCAGPGLLAKYLPSEMEYSGFDINPRFVSYAQKKGLKVKEGDAHQEAPFQVECPDAVVLVDALHHLQPYEAQQRLIQKAAEMALRRIIICEPYGDRYSEILDKFPSLKGLAARAYNWIERDGSNQVRFEEMKSKEELTELANQGFGVIQKIVPRRIAEIGPEDLLITYYLR
ncbi:MAG: class I SAM-dependent methyltransferase [Candidatus Woesearchaeota archaeon]|jgi:hypothetical protein